MARVDDPSWRLFCDWCAACDVQPVPAARETIEAFLADLPASKLTTDRRVLAIRRQHAALRWPDPLPPAPPVARAVDPVLAELLGKVPVYGWPDGVRGRRDGFLLVLRGHLRLTRPEIRELSTSAVEVAEVPGSSEARVRVDGIAVTRNAFPGGCPVCTVTRWLRILALAEVKGWSAVRNRLAGVWRATAAQQDTHDCTRTLPSTWSSSSMLLPAIDKHGSVELHRTLSARSISTIMSTSRMRETPFEPADTVRTSVPNGPHAPTTWDRRAANQSLAELDPILDALDAEIDAAIARSAALLAGK